jgi:hypothetical protein
LNLNDFRCSVDLAVIASLHWNAKTIQSDLYLERPAKGLIAPDVRDFAISSSGNFLAFVDGTRVCVISDLAALDSPACIKPPFDVFTVSVNDRGQVLFGGSTMDRCWVRPHEAVIGAKPMAAGWAGDSCPVLYWWQPPSTDYIPARLLATGAQFVNVGQAKAIERLFQRKSRPK